MFEQVKLFFGERERERESWVVCGGSGSGKVMRERGSLGSGEVAQLNGINKKPCHHRKWCTFKKMLSQ